MQGYASVRIATLTIAVAVAVAGCGGSDKPEQEPRAGSQPARPRRRRA